jgi:capsular exopolysaccharide synthesis family protein
MGYVFDALKSQQANKASSTNAKPRLLKITEPASAEEAAIPNNHSAALNPIQFDPNPGLQLNVNDVDDRLVAFTEPRCQMAEEYRAIRTGILARWQNGRHLIHTMTSATPQEGKTLTSLNLGFSFAELHNRRAIVIEADLRLPQFKNLLGLPHGPGLVDLLENKASLAQVIQRLMDDRLHVIAAGRPAPETAVQLLSSPMMNSLLKALRAKYDHVIIDTPPVIQVVDAGIVGAIADDVLLIARMGRTSKTLIDQAVSVLSNYNASVAGLIATDQQRPIRRYSAYKQSYQDHNYYKSKAA